MGMLGGLKSNLFWYSLALTALNVYSYGDGMQWKRKSWTESFGSTLSVVIIRFCRWNTSNHMTYSSVEWWVNTDEDAIHSSGNIQWGNNISDILQNIKYTGSIEICMKLSSWTCMPLMPNNLIIHFPIQMYHYWTSGLFINIYISKLKLLK